MDTNDFDPNDDVDSTDAPSLEDAAEMSREGFNAHLQAELDRYKRDAEAMQQEFNTIDEDDSPAAVKKALIAAAPAAIQEIILLASHGDGEGVRLNASKYIVDIALGKVKLEAGSDGFDNLIKGLMADKKATDDTKKEKKHDKNTTNTEGAL